MRVLITGIGGFVGGHLARALHAAGAELHGISNERVHDLPDAKVDEIDILDREALRRAIERRAPDAVVHLAGLSHVGESWQRPGDYLRVNFEGTYNLIRAVGDRRLIFASSAEVYGFVPEHEQPLAEDRPLAPRSPYAMTKACAETLALDQGAIVVRSFNAVGVGQSPRFALPSFAAQLAAIARGDGEPVLRVGDLSSRRDFIHVDDVAAGYRTLIERGAEGTVYNLASGNACSIADALERLRRISGVDARIERDEKRVRPVDIPLLLGANDRLRSLGWAPRKNLDSALRELWQAAAAGC